MIAPRLGDDFAEGSTTELGDGELVEVAKDVGDDNTDEF